MLDSENIDVESSLPRLESFAPCSTRAKFVEMPDASMEPDIFQGDHLLFDPTEVPTAGDVVLVRSGAGEHFVRQFRIRSASTFEASSPSPHFAALSSDADALEVVGVMVEHRRYRRPSR